MLRKVGLLALVLTLTLLVSGAAQAMPLAGSARSSESRILDRLWGWIEALFRGHSSSAGQLKTIWAQDSSHIDPNGGNH